MNAIMMLFYRWIVVPWAILVTGLLYAIGHKKIQAGFKMRMTNKWGKTPWSDCPKDFRPIWMHCSSGEFEYAKSVIRQLKRKYPAIPVLVTYFSPTYQKNIESTPEVDFSGPLPWDLPGPISFFIKDLEPRCLLIARTDLWPEVLYQCKRRKVPTLLFSATQKPWPPFFQKLWKSWLLSCLTEIYCVSEADQTAISKLYKKPASTIAGDTRYDQAYFRLQHPNEVKASLFENKDILLAGSTWIEDEINLVTGAGECLRNGELHMVIAPHEPTEEHIAQLEARIHRDGLHSIRYSQAEQWRDEEVLIIDCVGILADLYKYAQLAFIGGSYKKSVHSVMEALITGCTTLVGPCHTNNREAIEFQEVDLRESEFQAVNVAKSGQDLTTLIQNLVDQKDKWPQWRQQIASEAHKKMGASEKVVDWVTTTCSLTPE